MTLDPRTIGEELLGLELVAGKELTEATGTLIDAADKGRKLWLEQARWLFKDYAQFWQSALTRPDPGIIYALVERRAEHIAEGFRATSELVEKELVPLSRLWTDYLQVVARDWDSSTPSAGAPSRTDPAAEAA